MRRLIGALLAVGLVVGVQAQTFPTPITEAISLLTHGVTPFTTVGLNTNAYMNFGTSRGVSGYGIRDNAGTLQIKNLGDPSWSNFSSSGGAPSTATYITQLPSSGLSAEQALSLLSSGLLLNTTSTGVLSAYAGSACTNQVAVGISALGVLTCADVSLSLNVSGTLATTSGGTGLATYSQGDLIYASASNTLAKLAKSTSATRYLSNTGSSNSPSWAQVALATGVSGTLPVGNGGTGLTTGTSGGVPYFSSSSALSSSAALDEFALVIGGGAGAAPATLGSTGTTTTVLHGDASGAPTFAAVSLSADTTGTLPATRGGTGQTSYAVGDLFYANTTTTIAKLAASTAGKLLRAAGTSTAPAWSTPTWTNAATTGDLLYASGADTYANLTVGATAGTFLRTTGTIPAWSTLVLPNAGTVGDVPITSSSNTLTMLTAVGTGQVLISGGVATVPSWSGTPFSSTYRVTTAFIGSGTTASTGVIRLANNTLITSRDAADTADISLLTASAADRITLGSSANTGLTVTALTKSLHWQFTVPTISSGFGTTPSIAGAASAFKVTVGAGGDTTGVVLFATTWTTAPVCSANNQTTAQLVRATPTTTQVTLAGTMAASDIVSVLCIGY